MQDRLKELEANYVQHETQRNELISTADRREKELGRDFEERGKAIALLSLGKAVDARGQTVKRIANNEAYPYGGERAGYVDFSFDQKTKEEQPLNESVKPNRYNQTVNQSAKPSEEKEPVKTSSNSSVNQTVITEQLTERLNQSLFSDEELKLIMILWANGSIKPHDSLVTRVQVLREIGDTKVNTTLLRNLYKKLLEHDYIYKRVGYFAKVGL